MLLILAVIGTGVWYVFFSPYFDSSFFSFEKAIPTSAPNEYQTTLTTENNDLPSVFVHVCGEVNIPGVYELPDGSRVNDAISLAGGFTENADKAYLNLARIIVDGEKIYVPSLSETEELSMEEKASGTGLPITNMQTIVSGENTETLTININTATIEELTELPGIGESRAKDIISYRNNVGRFEKPEDIKNVSGIGDKMFERMKDYIRVR